MQADEVRALAHGGLLDTLGFEIVELSPERVVVTMPIEARHLQPWGYLHGGATLALAETAASLGGQLHCPDGYGAFGMELNANHVRPKRDGSLTATATPLHLGRTTQVWDVKLVDETGRLISVSRCTVAVAPLGDQESGVGGQGR